MLEKTLESPLDCKEVQPVHPKGNQSWIFFGRTDAKAGTPIVWRPDVKNWLTKPWCWERLKARGEGDDRGWDGWMASSTQWTWVWVNSGSWWWTGRPGLLRFMGLQRFGHDWVTELIWTPVQISQLLRKYISQLIYLRGITRRLLYCEFFYDNGEWLVTPISKNFQSYWIV